MERLNVDESQVIQYKEKISFYSVAKRALDIFGALVGLILLSPFILITYIAIRVESEGKAIFSHERVGKNLKTIRIYKFRSMYKNSKEIFESFTEKQKNEYYINFKLDNDPRVTKVGKFIRKTSIDEIPQLINILKGDMSIVGPRPIVKEEISKYENNTNYVFSVIPGLTGYWQANGRSDTTYQERVEMDIYYVDNRSLLLDIKIIMKTIVSVIKKEGAF